MALDIRPVQNALLSHAAASGYFARINAHEPKAAPGNGLTAALFMADVEAAVGASSLESTSIRLEFTLRIFHPMLAEPQDGIDPAVLDAVSALMTAYSGDFTLGGLVRNVDLLGQHGPRLRGRSGYVTQDNKSFRIVDVTIPLILNDVFEQAA